MNIWTSIKNNKGKLIFFGVLFIIGIITGIMIFMNQDTVTKEAINIEMDTFKELISSTKQNQILFHLFLVICLFLLNFTVIGYLINIFYLFYEGCSFGFSIAVFVFKYKFSGLLFSLLFNVITKLVFVILILYICFIGIRIVKRMIGSIVLKKDEITYLFLKRCLLIMGIVSGFCLVNEILIYFFANNILKIFLFLL